MLFPLDAVAAQGLFCTYSLHRLLHRVVKIYYAPLRYFLQPLNYPPFSPVRVNFNKNPVPDKDADAMKAHLSREIRENFHTGIQTHPKQCVWKRFSYRTENCLIFFGSVCHFCAGEKNTSKMPLLCQYACPPCRPRRRQVRPVRGRSDYTLRTRLREYSRGRDTHGRASAVLFPFRTFVQIRSSYCHNTLRQ